MEDEGMSLWVGAWLLGYEARKDDGRGYSKEDLQKAFDKGFEDGFEDGHRIGINAGKESMREHVLQVLLPHSY